MTITRYQGPLLQVHPIPDPRIIDRQTGAIRILPIPNVAVSLAAYVTNPESLRQTHLTATASRMERIEIVERAPSSRPIYITVSRGVGRRTDAAKALVQYAYSKSIYYNYDHLKCQLSSLHFILFRSPSSSNTSPSHPTENQL